MSQTVIIRADASTRYGQGHTLRNRHLAEAFHKAAPQTKIIWAATEETFALVPCLRRDFLSVTLPDAPQREQMNALAQQLPAPGAEKPILVSDGYHLDRTTLDAAREHGFAGVSLFIDEKANRPLGDQNFVVDYLPSRRDDWGSMIGADTELLSGPDYQMVSPQFEVLAERRTEILSHRVPGYRKNVLLMNGGFNIGGMIEEILDQVMQDKDTWKDVTFKIFTMSGSPTFRTLCAKVKEALEAELKIVFLPDNGNIPNHMITADLYIGAAGMTPFELGAAGGIPCVIMAAGHNQDKIAALVDNKYAGFNVGKFLTLEAGELQRTANAEANVKRALELGRKLLDSKGMHGALSRFSREFCDGKGAARVAHKALQARLQMS